MTADELASLAQRQNANPYFLAYALATGAATVKEAWERDGNGARFLGWNLRQWMVTAARLKLSRHEARSPHHAEHLVTLAAAVPNREPQQLELFP